MTKKPDRKVVLCISGMAGSGKSTLARKLAAKYGLRYYSGGDALKALAIDGGYEPRKRGWWESQEGMRFLKKRGVSSKFDEKIDKKLVGLAKQGNVVLDSWTMPWLLKNGFKIWLEASVEKRAERIAKRDKISLEEATKVLNDKERETKAIYKKLYGFNLGEDLQPFQLILDVESLRAAEVFKVLRMVMDKVVHKSGLQKRIVNH